ncbi:MAG: PQQ-dependent sugar dehydrogenase [Acidimicrobiales bacterium]|nr:PQQ-dependent sugar dehydrogenase [Acidimicrobiales bacterium]
MTGSRTPTIRNALVALAVTAVLLAACSSEDDASVGRDEPTTTSASSDSDPTDGAKPLDEFDLAVREVGTFDVPTAYRVHPDGTAYVSEKSGRILAFDAGDVALDIRSSVTDDGEQGFLGFAFDRTGERLYVSYSDTTGDTQISEYAFAEGRADPSSARSLLQVGQPFRNHNGGDVHLGPDGFLYIALGDGGSSGDPEENGQDTSTLLGSVLRIDPTAPADGKAYGIPADNPFADGGGAPEIYLYGVRNPWRMAFDSVTDDLWIADVGQNTWEEVTVLPAASGAGLGANLGWDEVEGTHRFEGPAPQGATPPVFEYDHDEGCSITGGFVYRGSAIPALDGAYLFADLCRSTIRALRADGDRLVEERTFDVDAGTPISFGVDPSGEIVVLSQSGAVYRIDAG